MTFHDARLDDEQSALTVIIVEKTSQICFCVFANYMLQIFEVVKALAVKTKRFS